MACAAMGDMERAYEYARTQDMDGFKRLHLTGRCMTLLEGLRGRIRDYSISGISEIELYGLSKDGADSCLYRE